MYKNITIDELKSMIGKVNIIDVRDNYLYKTGNIPTSKNIPINFLLFSPTKYLEKDKNYYIYCTYGMQSIKACQQLGSMGYNVFNVLGGYNDYISKN